MIRQFKGLLVNKSNKRLVALLASIYATVRNKQFCCVSSVDNYWVHKHKDYTFVDLGLCLQTRDELFSATYDYYNYGYKIKPGDVVFDVGAGIGYETLCFAAACAPHGKVFSFEAVPSLFAILQKNIELNALAHVQSFHAAISNICGQTYFQEMPNHVESRVAFHGSTKTAVESLTIDSVVQRYQLDSIDFLKMNIEGFERYAIEGMRQSISKVRHVSIACHDFLSQNDQDSHLKTLSLVQSFLQDNQFHIIHRPDDPRPWIAHTLYASRV
ncbi:hypothetical protein JCM15519_21560 [Fundidesulfovibrio butyratiphilus]